VPRNTRGTSKTRKGGTATKSKGNKSIGNKSIGNKSIGNKSVRNKPIGNKSVKEGFIQGINPTEGESIFESYLSVLIHLLGTQYIYGKIVQEISDVVTIQEVPRRMFFQCLREISSILLFIIINQIPKKVRRMARMAMAKRTIGSTRMKRTRARVVKMPSSGR
jgi:Na+/serine symporter